jgi:hypothetical protein
MTRIPPVAAAALAAIIRDYINRHALRDTFRAGG